MKDLFKHDLSPDELSEWVSALRSGDYTQISGDYFGGTGCVCAIGLLAYLQGYNPGHLSPPALYRLEARLGWHAPKVIDMNDSGKTFEEIADYVETNL